MDDRHCPFFRVEEVIASKIRSDGEKKGRSAFFTKIVLTIGDGDGGAAKKEGRSTFNSEDDVAKKMKFES